jgi:tetratricopeptide (TPR) repeat protein
MAEKKMTVIEPQPEVNEVLEKAKGFWANFSKPIIILGSAVILLGGGWLAYKHLYKEPREEKASALIFPAENLFDKMTQSGFSKDSINLVLNGNKGDMTGVLSIISKFSGTETANRAHFIAGACYLHNKDFNNAVKQLGSFSSSASQVQTVAYMMLGDAHAELNKKDEAFSYYQKAAAVNSRDEFMTAEALYKCAQYAEAIGKNKEAASMLEKIRDEYPKSSHSADAEKSLARLGVLK